MEAQALEVDRKVERIVGESVRSGSNSGGQTFRTNMQKGKKRLSGLGALHINFFIYYTIIASMIIKTAFCKFLPNDVFSFFFFACQF